MCWGSDEAQARKTAHQYFRFAVPAWKVQSELPNSVNFAAASMTVREEDVAELLPCGPSVDRHLEGIQKFLDAGFERIAFLQAGRDQDGFLASGTGAQAPPREGRAICAPSRCRGACRRPYRALVLVQLTGQARKATRHRGDIADARWMWQSCRKGWDGR